MSVKRLAKRILSEKENMRYRYLLAKRITDYSQWLEEQKLLWQEENDSIISEAADDGEVVFICASKGRMTAYARKSIVCYFKKHPDVHLLYGDEDVQSEDCAARPPLFPPRLTAIYRTQNNNTHKASFAWFKPEWSPDTLDSCFYFGSLVAMRKALFTKMKEEAGVEPLLQTAKENDYMVADFPQYVQWMYKCAAMAGGYEKGARGIGHVAQILFHCDNEEELARYREALYRQEHSRTYLEALSGLQGENRSADTPLVSVVIPSKDNPQLLEKCIWSVKAVADKSGLEIIVVDNGSEPENKGIIEKLIHDLTTKSIDISYIYEPMEFNFSRMCNLGAKKAKGRFLLFLNDDVELAVQGCIDQMASLALRPFTGAVGIKLYYPDSERIQHAGITNLPMGPVHKLQFLEEEKAEEYICRGNVNYLAVTAACLMIEQKKFWEAGGFEEELQVAFNDVDLCFSLYELGYRNVCMNGSYAYHHESLSRGDDESVRKLDRLAAEKDVLYGRHPQLDGVDPYYSIYLNREGLDTCIRPAYETAGNTVQEYDKFLAGKTLYNYRRDECVTVRIEAVKSGEMLGWCAVLGDNNACYSKELMLKKIPENFSEKDDVWFRPPDGVYTIPIEEQYRPDLQENMPDQENVALCGFHIRLRLNLLPPGRYRIGAAVSHRITGLALMNWSNRYVEL